MCVELSPRDLNPSPCPPHATNTYICGVTIAPRVHSSATTSFESMDYLKAQSLFWKRYYFDNKLKIILEVLSVSDQAICGSRSLHFTSRNRKLACNPIRIHGGN